MTDPPRGQEEWIPVDPRFQHGVDLIKFIRSVPEFASEFCIGVAGWNPACHPLSSLITCTTAYPDGHTDSAFDEDTEIELLKEKVDAGADFIITQLFYDVDHFLKWLKKVRQKGTF